MDDYLRYFPDDGSSPYEQMTRMKDDLNLGLGRGEVWTTEPGERCILVMSKNRDPFYCGLPFQVPGAEWFARLFDSITVPGGLTGRVLIRQVHYVASGEEQHPVTGERLTLAKPYDGEPYRNTREDHSLLEQWSIWARNMGLVDPRRLYSRRGDVALNAPRYRPDARPYVVVESSPSVEVSRRTIFGPSVTRGEVAVRGYDLLRLRDSLQPSLVEVWVEKQLDSEEVPVIADVCAQERANLVVGAGFMTISEVYAVLERRARLDKPLRILYLSDFDPAGRFIALHPARHVEFALRHMDPRPDIRLKPLALHRDQVEALMLPRQPIKESDLRKKGFEARHGIGAVELNSLTLGEERIGFARNLLRRSIRELRDDDIPRKILAAEAEAERIVAEEHARRLRWVHKANDAIVVRARSTVERLRAEQAAERAELQREIRELKASIERQLQERYRRLEELDEAIDQALAPLTERAERVSEAADRKMEGFEEDFEPVAADEEPEEGKVGIPGVADLGEEPEGVADDWAYDSSRDYLDQRAVYKERR